MKDSRGRIVLSRFSALLLTASVVGLAFCQNLLKADVIGTGAVVEGVTGCRESGTTMASCEALFGGLGPTYSGGGYAEAHGTLADGSIGAAAEYLMGTQYSGGFAEASVDPAWDFNISGGPTSGQVVFLLSANGTGQTTLTNCPELPCNSSTSADILIGPDEQFGNVTGGSLLGSTTLGLGNGTTTFEIDTSFGPTIGSPGLGFYLIVDAQCSAAGGDSNITCGATSDYSDTVSIVGAEVYDSSGNLVPGATLVSESGFNPNVPSTSPVPEPSRLVFLDGGLIGLASVALFRTRFGKRSPRHRA
jgi:hypothetical protein